MATTTKDRSTGVRGLATKLALSAALTVAGTAAQMPAHATVVADMGLEKVFNWNESYFLPGVLNLEFRSVLVAGDPALGTAQVNGQTIPHYSFSQGTWQPGAATAIGLNGGELVGPNDRPGSWGDCPCSYVLWDHRYMAFSFNAADGTHYGWLNFSVPGTGPFVIHDYAYEDQAGAPIRVGQITSVVPEPQTAVMFIAGLLGVLALRRASRA